MIGLTLNFSGQLPSFFSFGKNTGGSHRAGGPIKGKVYLASIAGTGTQSQLWRFTVLSPNSPTVVPPQNYGQGAYGDGAPAPRAAPSVPIYPERWGQPPVLPPGGTSLGSIRMVADPTEVRGCALLGEVRDDDLADLAKKVSKKGGNTALLTATVIKPGLIITGGAKRLVVAQAYECH